MDRNTKLLICYHVGKRDGEHAQAFADKLHSTITGRPTIFSDGVGPYTKIIPATWDGDCNFAQIVRSFVTPPKKEQQKYYPAAIIRVEKNKSAARSRTPKSEQAAWSGSTCRAKCTSAD